MKTPAQTPHRKAPGFPALLKSILGRLIEENVVTLATAAHDAIHRPGIFKTQLARHLEGLDHSGKRVKRKETAFVRFRALTVGLNATCPSMFY